MPMTPPKNIPWDEARTAWESGLSDPELARRFGCSRQAVIKRRARDAAKGTPWTLGGAALRPQVTHLADWRRGVPEARVGDLELADDLPRDSDPAVVVAREALEASHAMLRALRRDQILPGAQQSKADVFSKVISGASDSVRVWREVTGKKSGDASGDEHGGELPIIRVKKIVVSRPAAAVRESA